MSSIVTVFLLTLAVLPFSAVVHAAHFPNGTTVRMRPCDSPREDLQQQWSISPTSGSFHLKQQPSNCLEVWMASTKPGAYVNLWHCWTVGVNMVWSYDPVKKRVVEKMSGLCLTPSSTEKNAFVALQNCSSSSSFIDDATESKMLSEWNVTTDGRFISAATGFCLTSGPFDCSNSPDSHCRIQRLAGPRWRATVAIDDDFLFHQTYLSELYLWQDSFQSWSANMIHNGSYHRSWLSHAHSELSSTSIDFNSGTPEEHDKTTKNNGTWVTATYGEVVPGNESSPSSVLVQNIQLGNYASESWFIDVSGDSFVWKIHRTFLQNISQVNCSRFATFVWDAEGAIGGNPKHQTQILSTIEPDYVWSKQGLGIASGIGNATASDGLRLGWYYAYLNQSLSAGKQEGSFLFSPADVHVKWTHRTQSTTSSSTTSPLPGTATALSWQFVPAPFQNPIQYATGVQTTPSQGGPTSFNAGSTHTSSFSMKAVPDEPYDVAPFRLSTPSNPNLGLMAKNLSRIFNMWAGNMYGNSPATVTCLHELALFGQIFSILTPPSSSTSPKPQQQHNVFFDSYKLQKTFKSMLKLFAEHAVLPNGHVYPRWNKYQWVMLPIYGQQPQFLMAFYHYALTTGDKAFIREQWPVLMKVLNFLLVDMRMAVNCTSNSSSRESPQCLAISGNTTGLPYSRIADNWFDIVTFGHKDAIINGYAVSVLKAYSELADWLAEDTTGNTQKQQHEKEAAKLRNLHKRSVDGYNAVFWNETLGMYGDWVDIDGNRRHYAYLWQQALAVDPLSGPIANATRAKRISQTLDQLYRMVRSQYNVTKDQLWCTPSNFYPLQPGDSFWPVPYPGYENGDCFTMMMGFEMAVRGYGNDTTKVMKIFERVIAEFERTRLWGQHYDWPEGEWRIPDVLTDSIMTLWSFVRGAFGISVSLKEVSVLADQTTPAVAMEGASHTFLHKGVVKTVKVVNGKTVVVNGTI